MKCQDYNVINYNVNYLCLLELPLEMRRDAFAFRAFNVETAKAMDVASDSRNGLMRLLWWQDAIDKIYANKLIEHPIAQSLSFIISDHKISKSWLKRSIDARIKDAQREADEIPKTVEDLEKYSENTQSSIMYMTLQTPWQLILQLLILVALLLRSLPYHTSRQQLFAYIHSEDGIQTGLHHS